MLQVLYTGTQDQLKKHNPNNDKVIKNLPITIIIKRAICYYFHTSLTIIYTFLVLNILYYVFTFF